MTNRFLSQLLAVFVILVAKPVLANQLSASTAAGNPGASVAIELALDSGDASSGGEFTISFDSSRLTLTHAQGATADLDAIALPVGPGVAVSQLSLSYFGIDFPFSHGPLYSLWFTIADPYPVAVPDVTRVAIAGCLYDFLTPLCNDFPTIDAAVRVSTGPVGVPEPGIVALLGIAICALGFLARRRR